MDPFTLAALGIGTLGSLIGGIQEAAILPRLKRRYLENAARQARVTALRHGRWTEESTHQNWDDLYPGWVVDARLKKKQAQDYANANFKWNPMSLVPFVQSGTKLAAGIYDYANQPSSDSTYQASGPLKLDMPTGANAAQALTYYDETKPYYDPKNFDPNDLVYRGSVTDEAGRGTYDYTAGRHKYWWED